MKNTVMETKIKAQQRSVATFRKSLEIFAANDDGVIDKEEEKIIRKITKACIRFETALEEARNIE